MRQVAAQGLLILVSAVLIACGGSPFQKSPGEVVRHST